MAGASLNSFLGFLSRTPGPSAVLVDELDASASSEGQITRLSPRLQLLFNGFAEFDVVLGHVRRDVAVLEEGQHPLDPSGTQFGLMPLGALRGRALSGRVNKLPGGFGFERKNHNEAVAIDVDSEFKRASRSGMELLSSLQEADWMCCEGHA
jgi:hypothetical protein